MIIYSPTNFPGNIFIIADPCSILFSEIQFEKRLILCEKIRLEKWIDYKLRNGSKLKIGDLSVIFCPNRLQNEEGLGVG